MTMQFTNDKLDELLLAADGIKNAHAAPEEGPYYLHDLVEDEGALAEFLEILVPLARALIGDDTAEVMVACANSTRRLHGRTPLTTDEEAELRSMVTDKHGRLTIRTKDVTAVVTPVE